MQALVPLAILQPAASVGQLVASSRVPSNPALVRTGRTRCNFCLIRWRPAAQLHVGRYGDFAVKLGNSFSGALRTFSYFMSSGTHYMLQGVDYLNLYGSDPNAIEQTYAIFANVLELDENGQVMNGTYAQKRATDYLNSYCDLSFQVVPPFEDWELALHEPPPLKDQI